MLLRTFNMHHDEITAINLVSQESRMSLINAQKNRVHWPGSEVHHSPPQFFVFKAALFISICLQILRENNAKDRIRSWKIYVYTTSFVDRNPPFKIQSSPNSVGVQKKLIVLFLRVINISEKNPRKPVPILREEIRDFKLLRHVKLPDTDSKAKNAKYHCTECVFKWYCHRDYYMRSAKANRKLNMKSLSKNRDCS